MVIPGQWLVVVGPVSTRILVTGSRSWIDNDTIRAALEPWRSVEGAVLVHGDAVGADRIAATIWRRWGLPTEEHPAQWATHHRAAGMRRNAHMVALGAEVCLAFIRDHSPGASQCADLAERAGITTQRHRVDSHTDDTDPEVDLFGAELPPAPVPYQVTNDIDEVHAVLRIAGSDGYTVSGRRGDRIWRLTGPGQVLPVPRHEADTVRQLIDQQWLHIGGTHHYHHGAEDVNGRSVLVPKSTKRQLTYWDGLTPARASKAGERR